MKWFEKLVRKIVQKELQTYLSKETLELIKRLVDEKDQNRKLAQSSADKFMKMLEEANKGGQT